MICGSFSAPVSFPSTMIPPVPFSLNLAVEKLFSLLPSLTMLLRLPHSPTPLFPSSWNDTRGASNLRVTDGCAEAHNEGAGLSSAVQLTLQRKEPKGKPDLRGADLMKVTAEMQGCLWAAISPQPQGQSLNTLERAQEVKL